MPSATAFYQNPYGGGTAFPQSPVSEPPGIQIPPITASNAHVVNAGTGQVYYQKGDAGGMTVPASIAKLMTVLLLLEAYPTEADLAQTTTILSTDLTYGSGNNLEEGDIISLLSLAYNCILPSSNSGALAVSRVIGQDLLDAEGNSGGDPYARFVTEMNARADSLGMTNTTYFEPTGLDSSNASLPVDCNVLMEELYGQPVAQTIFSTANYDMPLTREGSAITVPISSTVDIISDPQVLAGKTGTLSSPSTHNLAILWRAPNGDSVAACVFGSTSDSDRYSDMSIILDQLVIDYPSLMAPLLTSGASSSDVWAVICQSATSLSANALVSDSFGAISAVNTSIIAAAQASDSTGDQPFAVGSLNQSATGNDALDALANAASALSAGAAAGESWTVQAQVVVNMLEQGAAADQIQRQTDTAINAALAEQSAASDQFVASINAIAALTDGAIASDAYLAVVAQLGSIASGAIASDSFGLTFGNAFGLQSGALSSDAWLLMATVSGALLDTCTADDLLDAKASVTTRVTAGAIATARFAIVNAGIQYLVMGSIILRDALNYRVTHKPALNQSVKIKPGH